jgi:hypothetical protein
MKFRLFIVLICLGVKMYAQNDSLTYSVADNTLSPHLKFTQDAEVLGNHYTRVEGIRIAKFYVVLDSLFIKNTEGKPEYCMLVLSNVGQDGVENNEYTVLPEGKRLLVVLKYIKGKYVIDYVNENVILNVDYSQSEPFLGIKRDSAGFYLKYFIGSVNKCTFIFHFKLEDDKFYLSSYNKDAYRIDLMTHKKKEYTFKEKSEGRNLKNIRIEKYLVIPDMGE